MTYYIGYTPGDASYNHRGWVVFDIEYYMNKDETSKDNDCWNSEIYPSLCPEGVTRFLKDKFKDESFDYEAFIKDAEYIDDIRGYLYEHHDNRNKTMKDAENFHYHVFGPKVDKILKDFADKWGLWINKD